MKRRWVVEWDGKAQMYGYTLIVGDPVVARTWLRSTAERIRARLAAERMIASGTSGHWIVRRV